MSNFLYKLLNPVVKSILKSPFHGLLSGNTIIIQYTGRRSGKAYSLPVSYAQDGDQLSCFTARTNKWWRNLEGGRPVTLLLRGKQVTATADIEAEDDAAIAAALVTFIKAVPRDAPAANIRMESGNSPNLDDVAAASKRLANIVFHIS